MYIEIFLKKNRKKIIRSVTIISDVKHRHFYYRLYWIDRNVIKSSTTSGVDIKRHLDTNGATKAFVYKVI